MKRTILASVLGAAPLAMTGTACADVYSWAWHPGGPGGVGNAGGAIAAVDARFNTQTNRLTWDLSFSDQIARGFTLALNDGPNPKGHAGELALVYFDASDVSNVRVSAYAYNGLNAQSSYRDGSPLSGTQSPDLIFGSAQSAPWVIEASVSDSNAGRTMRLVLDATAINAHTPALPGPEGPSEWHGIGFGPSLGVWLHTVSSLTATYNESGELTFWSGRQGWLDGSGFETQIPAPSVAIIALAGLGATSSNRRR